MENDLTYDALVDLRAAIERQIELQAETNLLLRNLITVLTANGEATANLADVISQMGPDGIIPTQ